MWEEFLPWNKWSRSISFIGQTNNVSDTLAVSALMYDGSCHTSSRPWRMVYHMAAAWRNALFAFNDLYHKSVLRLWHVCISGQVQWNYQGYVAPYYDEGNAPQVPVIIYTLSHSRCNDRRVYEISAPSSGACGKCSTIYRPTPTSLSLQPLVCCHNRKYFVFTWAKTLFT